MKNIGSRRIVKDDGVCDGPAKLRQILGDDGMRKVGVGRNNGTADLYIISSMVITAFSEKSV